jgi:hypothetical protein
MSFYDEDNPRPPEAERQPGNKLWDGLGANIRCIKASMNGNIFYIGSEESDGEVIAVHFA